MEQKHPSFVQLAETFHHLDIKSLRAYEWSADFQLNTYWLAQRLNKEYDVIAQNLEQPARCDETL